MKKAVPPKPKEPAEKAGDDFLSVARRIECDEDKELFEAKLGKIARQNPQDSQSLPQDKKPRE